MNATVVFSAALLGVTCFTVIAGCAEAPPSQRGRTMTGEEIKSLLTHRSEETTNSMGGLYRAYHPDSETEIGRYTDPKGTTSDVRARLSYKVDAICAVFDRKDWGYQCYQYEQNGEKIVYRNVKDKNDFGQVKILDGNPFGF